MQKIPFQVRGHRITKQLYDYVRELLSIGFTNKYVARITGLGKNTVKEIDKKRLLEKFTIDGRLLKKPERQSRYLGIVIIKKF